MSEELIYLSLKDKDRIQFLVCRVCAKPCKSLGTHVKIHGLAPREYQDKFEEPYLACEETRFQMASGSVRWNRDKVLGEIRERSQGGKPPRISVKCPHDSLFLHGAQHHFGSWQAALLAAGLKTKGNEVPDPETRPKWTKGKVTAAIRRRAKQGLAINSVEVLKDESALHASGSAIFGNWSAALSAAGFDPDQYKGKNGRIIWTEAIVEAAVRKRHREGKALNSAAVRADDPDMLKAARRRFGGWSQTLVRLGIDPHEAYVHRRWSGDEITAAIRQREQAGSALTSTAVYAENPRLWQAARRKFGAWATAMAAAGLNPEDAFLEGRSAVWTKRSIIEVIRQRHRENQPLNSSSFKGQMGMVSAARNLFGSWDAAMTAAGFSADKHRLLKRWSKEKVIAEIVARTTKNKRVNAATVSSQDAALSGAAIRLFGSWTEALRAANVNNP